MSKLLTRLNIIQSAITLGDEDIIVAQIPRLPPETKVLADLLAGEKYADAASWILDYLNENTMIVEYTDPEISGLQLELDRLEIRLTELSAEKSECWQIIEEFNAAYMEKLGELLEKILQLKLQREETRTAEQDDDELNQARRAYEEFTQQRSDTPPPQHLSAEQKQELKKLFRQSAHKCHPDRLSDENKEAGAKMFRELEEAYRKQDLSRVREIWRKLAGGDWTAASASASVTDKEVLRKRVADMRQRIEAVQAEFDEIQTDETWQLIESLAAEGSDWDDYFTKTKVELEMTLAELL